MYKLSLLITNLLLVVILSFIISKLLSEYNLVEAANGRFGGALGTWNYDELQCYAVSGEQIDCKDNPVQHNPVGVSDMEITSYDQDKHQLSKDTFNVSSFHLLDPNANTQFIWFHYEDYLNPLIVTSGKFDYFDTNSYKTKRLGRAMTNQELSHDQEKLATCGKKVGADIYATSGAPGSIRVNLQYEPGTNINNRGYNWRIRLDGIEYDQGYPYCIDCIFQKEAFFEYLNQHQEPIDSSGNWYGFYVLAETEYGIASHYFEPIEYAAVLNYFVREIKTRYPNARFILQSPVAGIRLRSRYETYFNELYRIEKPLLSPLTKDAITFNSADLFYGPPDGPDFPTAGYSAVTDEQLQKQAQEVICSAEAVGKFFYMLNGKKTLLTQTGASMHRAVNPEPKSLTFGGATCNWCANNNDVWKTTEYGSARLTQLVYRQLNSLESETHIAAWAYWGIAQQPYWTDPFINKTWGNINHGIYWLSWPFNCSAESESTYGINCPEITNKPWPTRPGMIYLKMANGETAYVPENAPDWWPRNETITTASLESCNYIPTNPPPSFQVEPKLNDIISNYQDAWNNNDIQADIDNNCVLNIYDYIQNLKTDY